MRKYFIVIPIVLGLGMLSWAQGSKDLFDVKKSEAELNIMKVILSTTLSYAEKNQQKKVVQFDSLYLGAYYLVGQGATFVISASPLHRTELTPFLNGGNTKLALELSKLKDRTQILVLEAQKQAAELSNSAVGSGLGSGVGPGIGSGIGSGSKAPPAPPAPLAPPQIDREGLQTKVGEFQMVIKKSREEAAANQEKFVESLKETRVPLIEALANYGDSLTQVKPGEYVNLILTTEDTTDIMDYGRAKTRHDIISAQKSWITDYKAGRITLEGFKQKVLQYTE